MNLFHSARTLWRSVRQRFGRWQRFGVLACTGWLIMTHSHDARAFQFQTLAQFPMLAQFDTVEAFERHYRDYERRCLDATYGGQSAIRCLVGGALWEREAAYYYRQLLTHAPPALRRHIETGQRAWQAEKAAARQTELTLIRRQNRADGIGGSMARLIEHEAIDRLDIRLNRARALLLRHWLENLQNGSSPPDGSDG